MTENCSHKSLLFYRMNTVYKEMNVHFEEETGISFTKLEILFFIYGTPNLCQQDIQKKLAIDAASVTRHLKKLETDQFIQRVVDPTNKRFRRISLTEKGRKELKTMITEKDKYEAQLFANISEDELEQLWITLNKLSINSVKITKEDDKNENSRN